VTNVKDTRVRQSVCMDCGKTAMPGSGAVVINFGAYGRQCKACQQALASAPIRDAA
jgi:hypothetical protein